MVSGNGLVEAGTFLGILIGTIAGGALFVLPNGPLIVSIAGLVIAGGGIASALFIPTARSDAPDLRVGWNLVQETTHLLSTARGNRPVWLCLLGISWFWVVGATLLAELPTLVRDDIGADAHVVTLMLTFFSVGVGAGSLLCSRILKGEVTARHVPFAAVGLSVFIWDFAHSVGHVHGLPDVQAVLSSLAGWRMLIDLLLLSACGGLYSVPLYAIIQEQSAPAERARMIAANNVVNALAMAAAAVVTALLALVGMSPVTILLVTAVANFAVALWIVRILPRDSLRVVFQRYFEMFHGVDITGLENIPPKGQRAIYVCNHQSFGDGCFLAAFLPGNPTFAVDINTSQKWWARPFMAAIRHFDVDPANAFSTKAMVRAVKDGERLVIFPEGRITRTGALMKVYEGAGLVADKAGAVIVPIRIDGLQYSLLSRLGGRVPRRMFPRLSMKVLPPVALDVPDELHGGARRHITGSVLQTVMEQSSFASANTSRSIFTALLDARARYGAKMPVIEDIERKPVTYGRIVLGAAVLGRELAKLAPLGGHVGVMLPNANGAVVTFMALQAFGRVPAMLNFTPGQTACSVPAPRLGWTSSCHRAPSSKRRSWNRWWSGWSGKSASYGSTISGPDWGCGRSCGACWTPGSPGASPAPAYRRIPPPPSSSPAGRRGRRRAWYSATATSSPMSARLPRWSISTLPTVCSTPCPCSTASA